MTNDLSASALFDHPGFNDLITFQDYFDSFHACGLAKYFSHDGIRVLYNFFVKYYGGNFFRDQEYIKDAQEFSEYSSLDDVLYDFSEYENIEEIRERHTVLDIEGGQYLIAVDKYVV